MPKNAFALELMLYYFSELAAKLQLAYPLRVRTDERHGDMRPMQPPMATRVCWYHSVDPALGKTLCIGFPGGLTDLKRPSNIVTYCS